MNFKWSQIEPLLQEAQSAPVTIELPTKRIAKLFRYSIYNYRRKKNLHKDLSIIIIEENQKYYATIYKPIEVYTRKVPTELITSNKSLEEISSCQK
jgi:hypothetical protein